MRNPLFAPGTLFSFVISLIVLQAYSQDTHYWTQQYGTRSSLLGGAAIGGVRDNSAVYYNPAGIAYIENKDLTVSANAYQADRFLMKDGAGAGKDLKSTSIQTMPLLISGLYKPKKYPRHTLGYCYVTKDQFDLSATSRADEFGNYMPDKIYAGNEDYVAQLSQHSSLREMLGGWGWGYKLSEKVSIGIGNYGSYRTYNNNWYRVTRVVPTDSTRILQYLTSFERANAISIKNVRTVIKAGISVNLGRWRFGFTGTSPSINIWGRGTIQSDVTATNLYLDSLGLLELSFTANDRQEGLKTMYKTPLILGFGFEYAGNKNTVAFSCEWFDKVDVYDVMKPKATSYIRPASLNLSSSETDLVIKEEKRSVFNFAIGLEHKINESYSGSFGFRTNKSYSTRDKLEAINLTYTNWNLVHFTLGATKKRQKSDISIGLNYGIGFRIQTYQWVNFTEANFTNFFIGEPKQTTAGFSSFSVMIGYTHHLK